MRCIMCGARIKPWFGVCFECYNPVSKNDGKIPGPVIAGRFMKEMKIDRW